jgi:uncharacterized protein YciI
MNSSGERMKFIVFHKVDDQKVSLIPDLRPAHLEHLGKAAFTINLGGVCMENTVPDRSLLVVTAEDIALVKDFVAQDPYVKAGILVDTYIERFDLKMGWTE